MTNILSAQDTAIDKAASLLKDGGLVCFPTETVYGLGANALDESAVQKIFDAKGRPAINPLIVHVRNLDHAAEFVEITDTAEQLATHFWPGALTFILKKRDDCKISKLCSAGLNTLAVRMPASQTAQKLLKKSGLPLAAPSANSSGKLSPTTPMHVAEDLGHKIDLILADGKCDVGLESTVINLTTDIPTILRAGSVTKDDVENALSMTVHDATHVTEDNQNKPHSPGQLLKHYAPNIPVRMNAVDLMQGEALLAFGSDRFMGIRGGGSAKDLPDSAKRNLSETQDLYEAAHNLFAMLHDLDIPDHKGIAVMPIPNVNIGQAINDRLFRASQSRDAEKIGIKTLSSQKT